MDVTFTMFGLKWRFDVQFYDKTHDYEKDMKVVEERKEYGFTISVMNSFLKKEKIRVLKIVQLIKGVDNTLSIL